MTGFPKEGKIARFGHEPVLLQVPFPCLRWQIHNKGPGRNKWSGE
jgi:hypothetical protein